MDFIGNHKAFLNKPESLFGVFSLHDFIQRQQADNLPLPKGCFVNYDVGVIDFLQQVANSLPKGIIETYELLRSVEQKRPTATEIHHAGVSLKNIREKFGSWFDLVSKREDLDTVQKFILQQHQSYLCEIEKTDMAKSYKMVLLEAMLELNGFIDVQTTHDLAIRSAEILIRRPSLIARDLPERFQNLADVIATQPKKWLTYWNNNPVNAFVGGNKKTGKPFFSLKDGRLHPNFKLDNKHRDIFQSMAQELVDFRFATYMDRKQKKVNTVEITTPTIPVEVGDDWNEIPFFPNLKIACGHFKNADTENETTVRIPPHYRADPARHFIARATGHSMDGGKQPIHDGDYLLLELVRSDSAGSISNQTMAVERQDVTGDDQYVLRIVRKRGDGDYYFQANNPEFSDFDATSDMRTFARLRGIIESGDINTNEN